MSRRSWWGWGTTDQALTDDECCSLAAAIPGLAAAPLPVPNLDDLTVPVSRLRGPDSLPLTADPAERIAHGRGKAFRDVARNLTGDVGHPPDAVAFPNTEAQVVDLLDWASGANVVVVPYGGGSSVVGGVEYRGDRPWISLDLSGLGRVLEIDPTSRAALIQAGAMGPALEQQLRESGLTMRFFPQSFEFSSLGGWIATRAGGHYATRLTHVDDLVESIRMITPTGVMESRRLPASGAGPSPDRLMLGSEGTLGVITQAWVRLQARVAFRASATVSFADLEHAFTAARLIAQSGRNPANARLLDPLEAGLSGTASDGRARLIVGVESADHPVNDELAALLELAIEAGGRNESGQVADRSVARDAAADTWRSAFLRMPYRRDGLVRMSAIVETFETAITWDRLTDVYDVMTRRIAAAITAVTGAPGLVSCRLTHLYPDGAAPYFTVIAAARPGSEVAMWDDIKTAAMECIDELQASVTHHHAIGRDHRPGYDRQRPQPFARALQAVKSELDPADILNPGVLIG